MTYPVRVRFAPSPTGALHIGGGHTALFNWLWARHTQGRFILRIEDTDRERSTKEYEDTILAGMKWLGLDWDEGPDVGGEYGPYRQSERLDLYHKYAEQLVEEGKAYHEGPAIIYRLPEGEKVAFDDVVYGHIEVMSESLLKDIVLIKSDGMPTYNYAVVVDDHCMNITYVIRGEDHISNTPKQILLYRALGWDVPTFAHLPMILGKDKKKLSKRHGATSVYEYRDQGYLPEGIFNFLAILGWSAGDDREVFTREELVELFELTRVTKKAAVFDTDKLNYINQEHLKTMDPMERLELVKPFWREAGLPVDDLSDDYLAQALVVMGGRGRTTAELAQYSDYFLSFDLVKERYDTSDISEDEKILLREFFGEFVKVEPWTHAAMEEMTRRWAEEKGMKLKNIAMPMRLALTGAKVSPGIFEIAEFFGPEEVKKRLSWFGLI